MLKLRIYTRFGSNSPAYLDICRDEWDKYEECFDELTPYVDDNDWIEKVTRAKLPYIISLIRQKYNHLIKAVTFGAMCLESFIYDYAANSFSDTYVRKYLDKLELVSKWVVIPRLTTGKDFPRESKAFEDLRRLIKERNDLVHAKSIPSPSEEIEDFIIKTGPKLKKEVEA